MQALDSLKCRRRVLLSGTPMQNHLDEVRPAPSLPQQTQHSLHLVLACC